LPESPAEHYNYFRDYDPGIGRYVESDPIGITGGLNTYGYAAANPLGNIDETGEANSGPGHRSGKWKECSKGCRIRIDHNHTGVGRHLHWKCRGSSGTMGEYGATSHGENSGNAPAHVKECARKYGFEPDPQPQEKAMCGDNCKRALGGIVVGCSVAFCALQPELCGIAAAGYAASQ